MPRLFLGYSALLRAPEVEVSRVACELRELGLEVSEDSTRATSCVVGSLRRHRFDGSVDEALNPSQVGLHAAMDSGTPPLCGGEVSWLAGRELATSSQTIDLGRVAD